MSAVEVDFSGRQSDVAVNEQFIHRWSPRAYADTPVPERDLMTMAEAARWSPSCYNEQPWRFYTSTPESRHQFLKLLVEANQKWAASAPVLGFVVASRQFARNGKDNAHADFDAGSAWMAFSLQASLLGYQAHGMAGIQYSEVYEFLGLDASAYQVICGFALGKVVASPDQLSSRKPLEDIWFSV